MGAAQERFPSTITALQSGVASQRARHDEAFVASVASARQFGPVLMFNSIVGHGTAAANPNPNLNLSRWPRWRWRPGRFCFSLLCTHTFIRGARTARSERQT